jgi:hypothetical protein
LLISGMRRQSAVLYAILAAANLRTCIEPDARFAQEVHHVWCERAEHIDFEGAFSEAGQNDFALT